MNVRELASKNNSIRRDIVKQINEFNKLRQERDKVNEVVRANKEKRQEHVNNIRKIITEVKSLNKAKDSMNVEDVRDLQKLINKKEWFFQVNVLSIKKEEQLMKEIKDLRHKLKAAKEEDAAMLALRNAIGKLEYERREHNKLHNLVIEKAEESNKISESMKVVQKEIKSLKKEGKDVSRLLKEARISEKRTDKSSRNRMERIKIAEEGIIKQKQDEAIEKLKNKKKLTTDDFFQR